MREGLPGVPECLGPGALACSDARTTLKHREARLLRHIQLQSARSNNQCSFDVFKVHHETMSRLQTCCVFDVVTKPSFAVHVQENSTAWKCCACLCWRQARVLASSTIDENDSSKVNGGMITISMLKDSLATSVGCVQTLCPSRVWLILPVLTQTQNRYIMSLFLQAIQQAVLDVRTILDVPSFKLKRATTDKAHGPGT